MSSIIPAVGLQTFIISAQREGMSTWQAENAHQNLATWLVAMVATGEAVALQHCRGAYKGEEERSLAITGRNIRDKVEAFGLEFGQESILGVSPGGGGVLLYMVGGFEMVGRYTPLESVEGVEAWSMVEATGELFTFS